jgi:hypothetical protein
MIDVETGVILAQPASSFEDSVVVSETSKSQGFRFWAVRVRRSRRRPAATLN